MNWFPIAAVPVLAVVLVLALLLAGCAERTREYQALQPCGAALFCIPI